MAESEFKAGPPGGANEEKPPNKAKVWVDFVRQRAAGLIWTGVDGYLLYAFCYVVLWRRVRFRNRGAAIAILTIFCVLNFYGFVTWTAMHAWGPGRVTKKYKRLEDSDPDAAFLCDEQGYALYCSYCNHIKPNRTHHASFTNTCVPEMDHFCPWVGQVIGQGNRKFFLQFSWTLFTALLLVLITLFIYQHDQVPHINGNSIALYCVAGLIWGLLFILNVQHSLYVIWSHTTLEHIGYRRNRLPYINIHWKDNQRRVVQPLKKDIVMPHGSPFDQGAWNNIKDVMGPVYTWLLPIRGPISEPRFNEDFINKLRERLDE